MALSQIRQDIQQLIVDVLLLPVRILEDMAKILGINLETLLIAMLAVPITMGVLGGIVILIEKMKIKKEKQKEGEKV